MKASAILVIGFAIAAANVSTPANATIVFTLGNSPQPGEELVAFADQAARATITGISTANSSNTLMIAGTTTTDNQLVASNDHVLASSGSITSLTITPSSPLDALILNASNGTGTLTISVLDNLDTISTFNFALGIGSNFLTIDAQSGETIQSLTVGLAPGIATSFTDLRNIGAVFLPAAVPEPGTWAMMLLGFATLAMAIRRKRATVAAA